MSPPQSLPARDRSGVASGLRETVLADARATAAFRGEPGALGSGLGAAVKLARLALVSDAFLAQISYRAATALRRRHVPLLPRLLHRLAIVSAGLYIDERAVVGPGLYVVHGQVVIAGPARIGPRVQIAPGVTVAPRDQAPAGPAPEDAAAAAEAGSPAPTIGAGVSLGSGARVLGGVTIGAGAVVGANAVVLSDVPAGATAAGIPATAGAGGGR